MVSFRIHLAPALAAATLLCASWPLAAQPASGGIDRQAPTTGLRAEPNVQHTVIEDDGVRIEELRVRGETRRIVVRSKTSGAAAYEIVPADGARDMSPGHGNSRGAAGKRVWQVLSF